MAVACDSLGRVASQAVLHHTLTVSALASAVRAEADVISELAKQTESDNGTIYFDIVPNDTEIPPIKEFVAAKVIEFPIENEWRDIYAVPERRAPPPPPAGDPSPSGGKQEVRAVWQWQYAGAVCVSPRVLVACDFGLQEGTVTGQVPSTLRSPQFVRRRVLSPHSCVPACALSCSRRQERDAFRLFQLHERVQGCCRHHVHQCTSVACGGALLLGPFEK